jgi:hypothetical protein
VKSFKVLFLYVESTDMKNSDLWVCIFDTDGFVHVLDLFSLVASPSKSGSPQNDTQQGGSYDVLVNFYFYFLFYLYLLYFIYLFLVPQPGSVSGYQNSSWTSCSFTRYLDTNDKYDFQLGNITGQINVKKHSLC